VFENGSKLKAYCTGRGEVEVTELLYKNESGMELHSFLKNCDVDSDYLHNRLVDDAGVVVLYDQCMQ
jgi:hypothetical protein